MRPKLTILDKKSSERVIASLWNKAGQEHSFQSVDIFYLDDFEAAEKKYSINIDLCAAEPSSESIIVPVAIVNRSDFDLFISSLELNFDGIALTDMSEEVIENYDDVFISEDATYQQPITVTLSRENISQEQIRYQESLLEMRKQSGSLYREWLRERAYETGHDEYIELVDSLEYSLTEKIPVLLEVERLKGGILESIVDNRNKNITIPPSSSKEIELKFRQEQAHRVFGSIWRAFIYKLTGGSDFDDTAGVSVVVRYINNKSGEEEVMSDILFNRESDISCETDRFIN